MSGTRLEILLIGNEMERRLWISLVHITKIKDVQFFCIVHNYIVNSLETNR